MDSFDFVEVHLIVYYFDFHYKMELLVEFHHILVDCMDIDHNEAGFVAHLMEIDLEDYNIVVYLVDFVHYHLKKILDKD